MGKLENDLPKIVQQALKNEDDVIDKDLIGKYITAKVVEVKDYDTICERN